MFKFKCACPLAGWLAATGVLKPDTCCFACVLSPAHCADVPHHHAALQLFYNNGRGSFKCSTLCPDPLWPKTDSLDQQNTDCWVNSARNTR